MWCSIQFHRSWCRWLWETFRWWSTQTLGFRQGPLLEQFTNPFRRKHLWQWSFAVCFPRGWSLSPPSKHDATIYDEFITITTDIRAREGPSNVLLASWQESGQFLNNSEHEAWECSQSGFILLCASQLCEKKRWSWQLWFNRWQWQSFSKWKLTLQQWLAGLANKH